MSCGCQSTCGCIILGDGSTTEVVREGDTFTVSATQFVDSVADTDCISLAVDAGELTATAIIDPDQDCVAVSCGPDGLRADLEFDPASTAIVSCGVDGLRIDVPPTPPTVDSAQPGDYLFHAGLGNRVGYLDADGTDADRITYGALWNALTLIEETATRNSGTPIVTGISSTRFASVGMPVEVTGFASGTTVLTVDSPTQLTLDTNAGSSGSDTEVRIYPYGVGDGIQTFTLPDLNRRFPLGYDNALGGETVGVQGGQEDVTLDLTQTPPHDHNVAAEQAAHGHSLTIDNAGNHAHDGAGANRDFVVNDIGDANVTVNLDASGSGNVVATPAQGAGSPYDSIVSGVEQFTAAAGSHTHTFTLGTADPDITITEDTIGGGLSHENMPPYTVGRWLVKT